MSVIVVLGGIIVLACVVYIVIQCRARAKATAHAQSPRKEDEKELFSSTETLDNLLPAENCIRLKVRKNKSFMYSTRSGNISLLRQSAAARGKKAKKFILAREPLAKEVQAVWSIGSLKAYTFISANSRSRKCIKYTNSRTECEMLRK
ncbi:hypothetical protein C0Q70_09891 [Pomacea canaliculata]|uniref:Uncharacterized protein n=1 Tax=Pomacea canaliculata TaxID=400727 RepID=A0A2T7PB30_POMCA|nr:hypothetical protein C0Q70_09891 [Pomacea canaliculata]